MLRPRRVAKWIGLAAAGLAALLTVTVTTAVFALQGERLAAFLGKVVPPMQGSIAIRAVHFKARALLDLVTDRPTPIVLEGVKITDPEGTPVLEVPRLEVAVRPRSAIRGKVYLHGLKVGHGSFWRFGTMRTRDANGFLTSLQPKPLPDPPPSAASRGGFVFQIVDADLDGLRAVFDFPGLWGLELRNIKAPASLILDGDFVGWDVVGLDARAGGYLRILDEVLPFDRVWVNRVATTRDFPDDIFLDVKAARTGRSTLSGKGFFTGIYGYGYQHETVPGIDMHAELDDAADALAALAARRQIAGLRLGGTGAQVTADLKDAFARLKIDARVSGLDAAFGPYAVEGLALRARMVVDPLAFMVEELTFAAPRGGRCTLAGALAGQAAKADMSFHRLRTASYLPVGLRKLGGGTLTGRLSLAAVVGGKPSASVRALDLTLVRDRAGGLPRTLRLHGQASASAERISTSGLALEVPGARADLRGRVELARKLFALSLTVGAANLPRLLGSIGLPPLARKASAEVQLGGSFDEPTASGRVVADQVGVDAVPRVPHLETHFRLAGGTLHVDALSASPAFGGALEGKGELALFRKTIGRMLRVPVVSFRLHGREVDIGELVAGGSIKGRLSFSASAEGPVDRVQARLEVTPGAEVEVLGAAWRIDGLDVVVDRHGLVARTVRLEGRHGGRVTVEGRMASAGAMSWRVAVDDLPLEAIPGVAAAGVPASGRLSAEINATGGLPVPVVNGRIVLRGLVLRGRALGDSQIAIAPAGPAALAARGKLFDGRIAVEVTAAHGPQGPRVVATADFRRWRIEDLVPELAVLGGGRGIVSGNLRVEWRPDRPIFVEARLGELAFEVTRVVKDARGQDSPQRVSVRNQGEVRAALVGDHLVLDRTKLVTDAGAFEIEGEVVGDRVRGALSGQAALDLLQPFLRGQLDRLSGDVVIELALTGTRARPRLYGNLAIARTVALRPRGFATDITIPTAILRIAGDTVRLDRLAVTIDDATVMARGSLRFDNAFKPVALEVDLDGAVSARLLESAAPDVVSDASGRVRVKAHIGGLLSAPAVSASLDIGPMEMRLRDLGRQFTIESGRLEVKNRECVLRDVQVRFDDQGTLLIGAAGVRPGRVGIKSFTPELVLGAISLPLRGERLSYRVSDAVEIDDLALDLELTGDMDGLQLGGEVRVVSGRYVQDFQVGNLVISPRMRESARAGVREGKSLVADMQLDLRVRTVGDTFIIQNNLAPEIHLLMDLHVGGTRSDPRLAGAVRPTDGRFHIPGIRGDFDLVPNVNHITFVETKSMRDGQTPELNLEAQNLVIDSFGLEHNVRMRIRGPVGQAAIELASDDGLDRNQIMLLLLSGRTTDETARFGTSNPTIGSNVSSATDLTGQITRDMVSNLVEPYIDDTLQLLTGRRLHLRPTVGADGFELKLGARLSRQLDLQLSFLRGFQNQQRYRGEGSLWVMDYLTLRGFYEQLTTLPQPGLVQETNSANLELTFDYPLRF